jgi:SAM-dependent methyltransferase
MDARTIAAYDHAPDRYADDWDRQPPPHDLLELVHRHFRPGPTADVGCGSGRDAAALDARGFDVVGIDASPGLLAEARRRHPAITFVEGTLPDLAQLPDGHFENVLCETVIMHLPNAEIPGAVTRLMAILRPGGALHLSWRVTIGADERIDGRLYSAFAPNLVGDALTGATVLHDREGTSVSSGRVVHRIVVRKVDGDHATTGSPGRHEARHADGWRHSESWVFGRVADVHAKPMHISSEDPSPHVT